MGHFRVCMRFFIICICNFIHSLFHCAFFIIYSNFCSLLTLKNFYFGVWKKNEIVSGYFLIHETLKKKINNEMASTKKITLDAIISLDSPSPPASPSVLSARHSDFTGNGYTNISTASANLNAALLANSFDAHAYLNFPDFSTSATQSSIDRLTSSIIKMNHFHILFSLSLFFFGCGYFSVFFSMKINCIKDMFQILIRIFLWLDPTRC